MVTAHGAARVSRAYYCVRCYQGVIPYDEALGLRDEISPGFRSLVCLAGTLAPFADAAEDIVRRYTGVRLSASTVLRCTEAEGERLRAQLRDGRMVEPTAQGPGWTAPREGAVPAAYVGLDAFSVSMQGAGGGSADHRVLYTAVVYTPDKKHHRYLVDFELDVLAEQLRAQTRTCGLTDVGQLVAITDGGQGTGRGVDPAPGREPVHGTGLVSRGRAPERLRGRPMRFGRGGASGPGRAGEGDSLRAGR
ncbi:hypothetical protein [Frigoriglobus tundricola]|uniref:hypothetical protein n=1 Tax=Frigoriglobus tundricola TaxID=2774151 RepID=UPI00148EB529|nr:hypothetical protein [Frigoriglobus tundricola]